VEYQLARILSGLCEGVYMYSVMRWVVFRGAPRGLPRGRHSGCPSGPWPVAFSVRMMPPSLLSSVAFGRGETPLDHTYS